MTAYLDVILVGNYNHTTVRKDRKSGMRGEEEIDASLHGKAGRVGPGQPRKGLYILSMIYLVRGDQEPHSKGSHFLRQDQVKKRSFQPGLILFGLEYMESQRFEGCSQNKA